MNEVGNVLVAAPVYDGKDYCMDRFIDQMLDFTYNRYDVALVDTSEDPEYHKNRLPTEFTTHLQPMGTPQENVTAAQNLLRRLFLAGPWEWYFSLENDNFVPANIIEYFLCHQYPVHAMTYPLREAEQLTYCLGGYQMHTDGVTLTKHMQHMKMAPAFAWMEGVCKPINQYLHGDFYGCAAGLGCCMIHRSVMEQITFAIEHGQRHFSDSFFWRDVEKKGITAYLDTRFTVEHDVTGRTYKPHLEALIA